MNYRNARKRIEFYELLTKEYNLFSPYICISTGIHGYISPDEALKHWRGFLSDKNDLFFLYMFTCRIARSANASIACITPG